MNSPIILVLLLGSSLAQEYFVDPQVVLVEKWEGWGTSLAWWADMLGGMDDSVFDHVTEAFFKPENLNLNIFRYVIGGTTPPDVEPYPCGEYREGSATESYEDGAEKPFNWTRDARQRKVLEAAVALNKDSIIEAFSNSPPQWMTVSGCAKGNPLRPPLHDNFDAMNAEAFAEYATQVISHFKINWNISFDYYSPFNEPYGLLGFGGWFGATTTQEGCCMRRDTMAAVIRSVDSSLKSKGMDYVTITAADETEITTAIGTANYFVEDGVAPLISKWNVHGYHDTPNNRRDRLNIIAHKGNQKLWMDEMGWQSTPSNIMLQAFDIGKRIVNDLRNMWPSAWVYWQAMESVGQWGVITVPYRFNATLQEVQYNSGYFGFKQFSKYIKQGYQLIHINDPHSVAAFHNENKELIIVTLNEGIQALQKTFDLGRFQISDATSYSLIRTSPTEQNVEISFNEKITEKEISLDYTSESITTVVISSIEFLIVSENLLKNGDFEDVNDYSWKLNSSSASETAFPWRGERHGHLDKLENGGESLLSQTITISGENNGSQRRLYLSLMASTEGKFSRVEALVNGEIVSQTGFNEIPSYHMYGLHFPASVGDQVTIQIRSDSDSGPVQVDDVLLYDIEQ